VTEEELVNNYPRLWHMAHDGAWEAIEARGLLSAGALLKLYEKKGEEFDRLFSERRPQSVVLSRVGLPDAVLRDQKPMSDGALKKCLNDKLKPKEWYETLNKRTFFWLSRERIWRLLKARAYRDIEQTVLTIDTAGLVAAHRKRIWLSPINSGSTIFNPQPRGLGTFMRIADFPFNDRGRTRKRPENVVELLVDDSVPDIRNYVIAVHRVRNDQVLNTVWKSPKATAADQP
jgi:hypothetical protein